jgi:hypothetical protein
MYLRASLCLALFSCACSAPGAPQDPDRSMPAPTEHVLRNDAEQKNKVLRKAWMAERHWAAPGVNWKDIEAQNGADQIAKRNALATSRGALAAVISRWTEIGSRNQAGRVHAATHSPDASKLYVGSSKAGIWRGDLDGSNWEPLGDNLYGGAHWLAISPGASAPDPDVLLAATDSGSVHYSTDDGATWLVPAGLPGSLNGVRRIMSATDGSDAVYLVARYTKSGATNTDLLRSTNGGASFNSVYKMGSIEGDAWCDRTGGTDLYVYGDAGLAHSVDGGQNWSTLTKLPNVGSQVELCGSEAGSPRFYAVTNSKLYRSDNGGSSWSFKENVSDYWGSLNASSIDPNLIVYGGVEAWRSTNGANSFSKVNGWGDYYGSPATKLHADIPGIDVVSNGPGSETWYVNTDGGLFGSSDGLANVQNLSLDGLRISQYYTTLTSTEDVNHIAAGAQDQGYQWAGSPGSGGSTLVDFDQVISGDYAHAVSSDGTHKFVYSVYPGFVLIQVGETSPSVYTSDFPAGENYSWLPFLAPDPGHVWRFFFCAEKLYRYSKGAGNSWSPTLWSSFNFKSQSGEYLTGLAFAPTQLTRGYAVTNQGDFFYSNDHGVTWSPSSTGVPGPHYFHGTAILASGVNPDTVYIGGSGYSNGAIWRSTDGGQNFSNWSAGLPPTLVYCLAEAPDGSGTMFCGTETSAYRRGLGDAAWVDITGNDAPANLYWSSEALPSTNTIRFGTYGRGIWDYSIDAPCDYSIYGNGIGGANTLTLKTSTASALGTNHVFEVSGGHSGASSSGVLGVGFAQVPIPFAGGTLLVDPTGMLTFPLATAANGKGSVSVTVPGIPSLAGIELFVQALLFDPAQVGGLSFSNGLRGNLCL